MRWDGHNRKEWIARGFLIIFGIMMSLLITEALLRLFFPQSDCLEFAQPDSRIGWTLKPNYSGVCIESGGQSVTEVALNSLGLRDTSLVIPKPHKTFRILILGDSMTFGAGVRQESAFSGVLEQFVIDDGENHDSEIEIINSGVPGYGTGQEYLLYERLANSIQPDLVILGFYVGNDIADNLCLISNPTRPCFSFASGSSNLELRLPNEKAIANYRPSSQRNSPYELQTLIFFRTKLENLINSQPFVIRALNKLGIKVQRNSVLLLSWYEDRVFEEGWRVTSGILDKLALAVDEDGATLVILVLPGRPQVAKNYLLIQNELYQNTSEGNLFNQDPIRPQTMLREWGLENDVLIVDPLSDLANASSEQPVYLPGGHFNETGNLIIGKYMFNALLESDLSVTKAHQHENDP